MRALALAAVVVALAVLLGATATAFAANAAPGDPLWWTAKLKLETMQLALATNPLREIILHHEFASRRLGELAELLTAGEPEPRLVEAVTQDFRSHVRGAVGGLERVERQREPQAAEGRTLVQTQIRALSGAVNAMCEGLTDSTSAKDACSELQQVLEAAWLPSPATDAGSAPVAERRGMSTASTRRAPIPTSCTIQDPGMPGSSLFPPMPVRTNHAVVPRP